MCIAPRAQVPLRENTVIIQASVDRTFNCVTKARKQACVRGRRRRRLEVVREGTTSHPATQILD